MINHYFFIRQFAFELQQKLLGSVLTQVVSSSRNEIAFYFEKQGHHYRLRLNWETDKSLYHFDQEDAPIALPKHYEKQLFGAWGMSVKALFPLVGERLICLQLEDGQIYLKLFGKMGNALYLQADGVHSVFKRSRQSDFAFDDKLLVPDHAEMSYQEMLDGMPAAVKLKSNEWFSKLEAMSQSERNSWFRKPKFDLYDGDLLPDFSQDKSLSNNIIELSNTYYKTYLSGYLFDRLHLQLTQNFRTQILKILHRIKVAEDKLQALQIGGLHALKGHLLLANLPLIPPGATVIELPNWHPPHAPVKIKLKPNLDVPANANLYFEKAKNEYLEIEKLEEYLADLKEQLGLLTTEQEQLNALTTWKALSKFQAKIEKTTLNVKPWRVFHLAPFEIWIGKSAESNDELLRKVHKDDLWMHARHLAGSHLVVRSAGKKVSQPVLETAASWAAWFSKGRNELLCPVIYTPRKFVRKPKGAKAGSVLVEKESVILVKPAPPTLPNE